MRVLWYVNIIMPEAALAMGQTVPTIGGWLSGIEEGLRGSEVELSIVTVSARTSTVWKRKLHGVDYIVLPTHGYKKRMARVLDEIQPDLVHVFGTEYAYNTELIRICSAQGRKSLISIQGMMYQCAVHYDDGLPERCRRINPAIWLMRRLYYADSVAMEKKRFQRQGELEKEALRSTQAVIGRTAWDRESALAVNPKLRYFHVNENLRSPFYSEPRWEYSRCVQNRIFVSQGFYPIKGLHMLLKGMPELIRRYPNARIVVGGQLPYTLNSPLLDKIVDFFFEYQGYIKKLIRDLRLEDYVTYTGPLDAQSMKAQYLRCNVFVSCSTIENSSNSIGEAMLLGVPIVASEVGGTGSILAGGSEGLLYDFYDRKGLVEAIAAVFEDPARAARMGQNAFAHASVTHNCEKNTADLLEVYRCVGEMKQE